MQGNLNLCRVPFQQMRLIPIRAPSSSPLSFPPVYFGISSWRAVRMRERARVQWLSYLWENDSALLAHRTKCKKQIAIAFMTTFLTWIILIFSLKIWLLLCLLQVWSIASFSTCWTFCYSFSQEFFSQFCLYPPPPLPPQAHPFFLGNKTFQFPWT